MGLPARGYKWADAEPGNLLALRHGARSRRLFEPVAQDLAVGLLEQRPDLRAFPDAVVQWAESEARAELLRKWVAEHGLLDEEGRPRDGTLKWLKSFEQQAESARRTLGLDPVSEAALGKLRAEAVASAIDLDGLRDRGREVRLEAERRAAIDATASPPAVSAGALANAVGDDHRSPDAAAPAAPDAPLSGNDESAP